MSDVNAIRASMLIPLLICSCSGEIPINVGGGSSATGISGISLIGESDEFGHSTSFIALSSGSSGQQTPLLLSGFDSIHIEDGSRETFVPLGEEDFSRPIIGTSDALYSLAPVGPMALYYAPETHEIGAGLRRRIVDTTPPTTYTDNYVYLDRTSGAIVFLSDRDPSGRIVFEESRSVALPVNSRGGISIGGMPAGSDSFLVGFTINDGGTASGRVALVGADGEIVDVNFLKGRALYPIGIAAGLEHIYVLSIEGHTGRSGREVQVWSASGEFQYSLPLDEESVQSPGIESACCLTVRNFESEATGFIGPALYIGSPTASEITVLRPADGTFIESVPLDEGFRVLDFGA